VVHCLSQRCGWNHARCWSYNRTHRGYRWGSPIGQAARLVAETSTTSPTPNTTQTAQIRDANPKNLGRAVGLALDLVARLYEGHPAREPQSQGAAGLRVEALARLRQHGQQRPAVARVEPTEQL
jgi:hypothetical protein